MPRKRRDTSGIPGRAVIAACLVLIAGSVVGCDGERDGAPETIDSVQFDLSFGGDVTLTSVDYVLTGPSPFVPRTGTLPVGAQPTIAASFQNLPKGTGYHVTVSGTASDGSSQCMGEATFDVKPAMAAVVNSIPLVCTGIASVSAIVSTCPTIDSLSVSPSEIYVGASTQLEVAAHDPDNGAVTTTWSATSGTLSNRSATGATFTCTAAGAFAVSVSVTNIAPSTVEVCPDTASVTIVCTPGAL